MKRSKLGDGELDEIEWGGESVGKSCSGGEDQQRATLDWSRELTGGEGGERPHDIVLQLVYQSDLYRSTLVSETSSDPFNSQWVKLVKPMALDFLWPCLSNTWGQGG